MIPWISNALLLLGLLLLLRDRRAGWVCYAIGSAGWAWFHATVIASEMMFVVSLMFVVMSLYGFFTGEQSK